MIYAISIIIFPVLAICGIVNVLRANNLFWKYGFDLFAPGGKRLTGIEKRKIIKYLLYFILSMIAFIAVLFLMAHWQQSLSAN